ncbi:MAG: hypothetical protein GXX91_05580 [Verrucomicrobiaceae bacterium]|nr:hypothetical protein [Verrucomicrobiaceae bacterium]
MKGLLSSLLALAPALLLAAEPRRVELGPESPVLINTEVPALREVVSERRLSGGGLSLIPAEGLYEWAKIGPTDEPFRLHVRVGGTEFEHATLSLWNWHNELVRQWRLPAGTEEVVEIAVTGLGTYLITLDGSRGGVHRERLIRNLSVTADHHVARAAWKTDEFFVGICAFPGRYHWKPDGRATLPAGLTEQEARDREADLMARLGLQVVRTDVSLEMGRRENEGGEPEYDFDFSRMDAAVEAYTSRGFQLALQTMNSADWAVLPQYGHHGKNRWRYPHREDPQRAYLAALVGRYREWARFVQIFNEPDSTDFWSGTKEEFVTQFTFSLDEIRRVAPDRPVTTGGYALVDEAKCAYFIDQFHDMIDFPAYHSHGNLAAYKRSFAAMKRLQSEAGDRSTRWVASETGYSAWRLEQERRQAQIDPQKVLYSWTNGHAGVLLFCSRMTRPPGRDGSPDFGVLDHQFCPRFAYGSLAALLGTLQGATFRHTLMESDEIHLYVFERGDDLIVAGFTLAEDGSEVVLRSDADAVVAIDEMGNADPSPADKTLTLSLDGYPRYWVLRGATEVRLP